MVWWGKAGEPDLMVVYNERWEPFTVNNLGDWSQGNWRILGRSWLGSAQQLCRPDNWQKSCPEAGDLITVAGRSLAILISDNN